MGRLLTHGLAALVLVGGALGATQRVPDAGAASAERTPEKLRVLVTPFVSAEGEAGDQGAILTEILAQSLERLRAVQLVDRQAMGRALADLGLADEIPRADEPLLRLGRAAGAALLVAGSYAAEGEVLRVRGRFVDLRGRTDAVLSQEATGPAADPFALQEQLVASFLTHFQVRLVGADEKRLAAAFVRPTPSLEAYALYAQGRGAAELGGKENLERAIELYGRAIELDNNFPLAHYRLGMALQANGNRWKAAGEYRKAIALDANFAEAHKRLGDLLVNSPRRLYDQAIQSYAKAIEIYPDFAEAYVGLGDARQARGQFDDAIEAYKQALALDPGEPKVHFGLGKIYYNEKGLYHEAVAAYQKAVEMDPRFLDAYLSLGELFEEKGLYQEAIARYTRALEIDPNHANAHYGLAVALEKVDRARAIAQWQRYIEIASGLQSEKDWLDIARKHLQKLQEQK